MKKKLTYILSLLMIVCMIGACGSDNAEKTYGGYTTDELHTEATDSLGNIQNYICLLYTSEKLLAYRDAGINRLSIGLQSANNDELKLLGRIHTLSLIHISA